MTLIDQVAQLRDLEAQGTPCSWRHWRFDENPEDVRICHEGDVPEMEDGTGCICCLGLMGNYDYDQDKWSQDTLRKWNADADLIVALRNSAPALMDVLGAFREGDETKLRYLTQKIIACADPRFGMIEFELIDRLAAAARRMEAQEQEER